MYLLYLDESGNPEDPADKHFVLGGAAVFERVAYFLANEFDNVQSQHFPGLPPIEFHAAPMRAGKGFWRNMERARREAVLAQLARVIATANEPGVALFAAVVEKTDRLHGEDAVKRATEEICRRFDIFLKRRYADGDPQRGLLVFAEGRFHQRARLWVRGFRELGTQWGILRNLSDIPYFASTRETRLLQVADIVSHAVYLLYERHDSSLAGPFLRRFDEREGTLHGLVHVARERARCECPACTSRRSPGTFGAWIQRSAEPKGGPDGSG